MKTSTISLATVLTSVSNKYKALFENYSLVKHLSEYEMKIFILEKLVLEMSAIDSDVSRVYIQEGSSAIRIFKDEEVPSQQTEITKATIVSMLIIYIRFAQVLDVNLEGFYTQAILQMGDPEQSFFSDWSFLKRLTAKELLAVNSERGFDEGKLKTSFIATWIGVLHSFHKYETEIPLQLIHEAVENR